jgi:hypothetical protein
MFMSPKLFLVWKFSKIIPVHVSCLPLAWNMPFPLELSWFVHPNNTSEWIKIVKVLVIQFLPLSLLHLSSHVRFSKYLREGGKEKRKEKGANMEKREICHSTVLTSVYQ